MIKTRLKAVNGYIEIYLKSLWEKKYEKSRK